MKRDRLYDCPYPLIGLTGGIGTGKTTASHYLISKGHTVICADQLVKEIYVKPEGLAYIKKIVPAAIKEQNIDFKILRKTAFESPEILRQIETFIYAQLEEQFKQALPQKARVIFYDVPLLFEKGLQHKFDETWLIYAPEKTQRKRLAKRDQISSSEIDRILSQQLSIENKKTLADQVIDNSGNLEELKHELDRRLAQLELKFPNPY